MQLIPWCHVFCVIKLFYKIELVAFYFETAVFQNCIFNLYSLPILSRPDSECSDWRSELLQHSHWRLWVKFVSAFNFYFDKLCFWYSISVINISILFTGLMFWTFFRRKGVSIWSCSMTWSWWLWFLPPGYCEAMAAPSTWCCPCWRRWETSLVASLQFVVKYCDIPRKPDSD